MNSRGEGGTSGQPSQHQAGIVAAKTKAVAHGNVNLYLAGDVRRVVKIAVGVGRVEINRRGDHPRRDRQSTHHQFDATAGARV